MSVRSEQSSFHGVRNLDAGSTDLHSSNAAGNHFNEWAGFDCEWNKLPSLEQQRCFLRSYLEASSTGSVSEEQV